ncbi:ATP-binding protein [Ascidiimonas sp. W6]|uniref:ATP-binding protein n=1 Tax=Ascidiimonas meishanensis TaxID=3128903 RepID=UPI0030EE0DA0
MKRYLVTLLILSVSFNVFPQNTYTSEKDSILKFFAQAEKLQNSYALTESVLMAQKVIRLSQRANDSYHLSLAHNLLGINYEELSHYKDAQQNYEKAVDYARLIGNDTLIGRAQNNLGNISVVYHKDFVKGNNYYLKARQIAVKHKDTSEILTPTINLAWNYLESGELDKAFKELDQAKTYVKQFESDQQKFYVNFLLGNYYKIKKQYSLALNYYDKAVAYGKQSNMIDEVADAYLAKSEIYSRIGETDKSIIAQKKGQEFKNQLVKKIKDNLLLDRVIASNELGRLSSDSLKLGSQNLQKVNQQLASESFFSTYFHWFIYAFLLIAFSIILWFLLNKHQQSQNRLTDMLKTRNEHLKAAKEEAEKLSRLKSQFISTVSHELRTPLYGVVGLTSLLLEENNLSSQENQYLKSLKFSGDYLLNLINDILNLSKIESNKVSFEKTPFNIRDLVEDVINSFKFQLDKKNNKIHVYIDKKIPNVLKGDDVPLSQILINLIGNAVKFTSYGNIWIFLKLITIEENKASVNFIVKDDGPGIPKEKHEEIFENFSQLDRENNEYQGTGLGLSIVKKLIDLMDGEIKLTSSEGEGAAFNFNLNFEIASESAGHLAKEKILEKNAVSGSIFGKGYKVLIVEDNKINQIVTKNILLRENFECEVVDNGLTAIEYVKRNKYDLILMDLNMPLMSGIDASIKIREFDQETPIVALTAVEIEDVKEDIERAEINDIINKPFDKSEFYKIILRNINKNEAIA